MPAGELTNGVIVIGARLVTRSTVPCWEEFARGVLAALTMARLPCMATSGSRTEAGMSHLLTADAASRRLVVLVNGLPAAGKTTLARAPVAGARPTR